MLQQFPTHSCNLGFWRTSNFSFGSQTEQVWKALPPNDLLISKKGCSSTENAMLHYHVSTIPQNRQTKHWLWREPFMILRRNEGHCRFSYKFAKRGVRGGVFRSLQSANSPLDATKSYTLIFKRKKLNILKNMLMSLLKKNQTRLLLLSSNMQLPLAANQLSLQ